MNHKRFRRLYREERLQVRRRGGRKRASGVRAPLALPSGPNERWSLDFVSDCFTDGRRFRILAVVDDFTREMPGAGRRTPRCRAHAWRASSMPSSRAAAGPRRAFPTTARSSPAWRS